MPDQLDQRIQAAYNKVKQEYPDVSGVNVSPSNSLIAQYLSTPNTYATTNPMTGNIYYNPQMMSNMNDDQMQSIMAHELTHSKQVQSNPWYKNMWNVITGSDPEVPQGMQNTSLGTPYYWKPNEMEAFQAQKDRMIKNRQSPYNNPTTAHGDIYLPMETGPSFMRGNQ